MSSPTGFIPYDTQAVKYVTSIPSTPNPDFVYMLWDGVDSSKAVRYEFSDGKLQGDGVVETTLASLGSAQIAGSGTTRLVDALKLAIATPAGWHTLPEITPFPRTRAGIIDAITAIKTLAGRGVIKYEDSEYDMQSGNLSGYIYSGISHIGEMPVLSNSTDIVDTNWTITGGTRFKNAVGAVFTANSVDKASPNTISTTGIGFAADGIYGAKFKRLGFIDCDAFDVGAANQLGLALGSELEDIYFTDPVTWGVNLENFIQCSFTRLYGSVKGETNGMRFAANVDKNVYIPGNSTFKHIYCHTVKAKSRRIVFEATQGSTLNEITIDRIQSNAYGPAEYTAAVTMTSGNANIAVLDATAFEIGMPVVFTSTVAGFTTNIAYYVIAVNKVAKTIQVALRPTSGTAVTPSASATPTIRCKGYAGIEVYGLGASNYGAVMHIKMMGIDVESETLVGVSSSFVSNGEFDMLEAFSNQVSNFAGRNSSNLKVATHLAIVTDLDDTTAKTTEFSGIRDSYIGAAGYGQWVSSDGLTGTTMLRCAGSLDTADFVSKNQSGVANYVMPLKPMAFQQAYLTGSAMLSHSANGSRTSIFSGATASTWTLPAINTAALGFENRLVNAGSAALTIQSAGELFNMIAGKTLIVIPAGGSLVIEPAKTAGGTAFWSVTASYTPT